MKAVSRKPAEAPPSRLAALSRLPLFHDLRGKMALVAGGTSAAAWKAELLAAAGADVVIFAEDAGSDMRDLLARGAAAGTIAHHRRPWRNEDLHNAAIAVADCETDQEAEKFHHAAKAAGVPCNTIDRRQTCDFEFGAIVNRSPVVIGISTSGAAPILGQVIRQKIETLLAPSLAGWAQLARDLRKRVLEKLEKGPARRMFWERFSALAFSSRPVPDRGADAEQILRLISAEGTMAAGRVTLVGAGPGDPGMLTLNAVRTLQSADVILFDDLVSNEVLELARREAKRMMVGKRSRSPSCSQDDINALMLKLARQGKHVVRLKSGDPMIFGRAGEELEELRVAGIAVNVVPGITAASALAARLGVSLTHRDCAQSVRFVTGHARTGELPADLDWRGLADGRTSLVFYMAGRTAPLIAQALIANGMDKATPVIIARAISRPEQELTQTALAELQILNVQDAQKGPFLLCIGQAFAKYIAIPAVVPEFADFNPVQKFLAKGARYSHGSI